MLRGGNEIRMKCGPFYFPNHVSGAPCYPYSPSQEQEVQLNCYKRAQRKLEEELRALMNELQSHKTALKQLQDSFFDKVHNNRALC